MQFSPSIRRVKSLKNPHLFLLPTHSNDYYNTYHQYKKQYQFYSKSIKVFQNTDLRMNSNFTFYPLRKDIGNDVNVTSIYSNTRTHILIFLYKTNLPFDLQLEKGEEQMWFSPSIRHVSVKNPHLHLTLPFRKITSLSFLLIIQF